MANMKLLLAAALIGTVSAAKECKYGSCIYMNGPQFKKGDKWGNLTKLKISTNAGNKPGPFDKCSCTDKYEVAPAGYTAAYSVKCESRLEDQPAVPGPAYTAKGLKGHDLTIYNHESTAEKCAVRCNATVGCGGFNFNYYDGEMTCNAVGVNDYCKGTHTVGTENSAYPTGPGKDNGLLTSRNGMAVFMRKTAPMEPPASWSNVPPSRMGGLITMQARGETPGPVDICIAEGNDAEKCKEQDKNQKLASGSAATASLVALAVAAAAVVKMC